MNKSSSAKVSRPYDTPPGPILDALMDALDAHLHAQEGDSWEALDELLVGLGRACRYGDASCECRSFTINWPYRLDPAGDGSWDAQYLCRSCGRRYHCWWSDEQ